MSDPYLEQMISDLAEAERLLRRNIEYRGMTFNADRLKDSRDNVARLHELIRSYESGDAIPSDNSN